MYRRCPTAAAWLVMCRLGYSNFTCSIRTAKKYEIGSPLSFLGWPGWACQFVLKPQTPVIVDSVRDFEHLSSQFLAFAFAIGKVGALSGEAVKWDLPTTLSFSHLKYFASSAIYFPTKIASSTILKWKCLFNNPQATGACHFPMLSFLELHSDLFFLRMHTSGKINWA